MNTPNSNLPHSLTMTGRKNVAVTGITELLTYDENAVTMVTSCGALALEGKGLHVDRLSLEKGEITICGEVNSLCYYERNDKKSGFWSKIIG